MYDLVTVQMQDKGVEYCGMFSMVTGTRGTGQIRCGDDTWAPQELPRVSVFVRHARVLYCL